MQGNKWDVFISHASEDKASFVVPLVPLLKRKGLAVWVDYEVLIAGDSLLARVEEGLSESRFGVVVLSEAFFTKEWTRRELEGLFALDRDVANRLIPLWHGVDVDRVRSYSPLLANRVAIQTAKGISRVATEVIKTIRLREAPSLEDRELERLIGEYDSTTDRDDAVRVQKKLAIQSQMMAIAERLDCVLHYVNRPTEGGRLAFAAILRQTPRKTELFRLIDTCRKTKHRFVWVAACLAIARHSECCRLAAGQKNRAVAEIAALQYRPLYKKSVMVRRVLKDALTSVESARS